MSVKSRVFGVNIQQKFKRKLALRQELQKTKDKATSSFNLISDVVEAIHNQKFPQLTQQQG